MCFRTFCVPCSLATDVGRLGVDGSEFRLQAALRGNGSARRRNSEPNRLALTVVFPLPIVSNFALAQFASVRSKGLTEILNA